MHAPTRRLISAHNLEVLADEDAMRPVPTDAVDLKRAVGQLHDTVNDALG